MPASSRSVHVLAAALVLVAVRAAGETGTFFEDAERLAREGDRLAAVDVLTQSLEELSGEERAHALFLLAIYTVDGAHSAERCREAVKTARTSVWAGLALVQLGEMSLLAGDPPGALASFEQAVPLLREEDRRARALIRSAQALLQMDRPAEARHRLAPAVGRVPPGPLQDEMSLAIATCDFREGNYADALERCLDLVRAGSALEPSALLTAAGCLMARGESALALQYLEELAGGFSHTAEGAIARSTADSLRSSTAAPPVAKAAPDTGVVEPPSGETPRDFETDDEPPPDASYVVDLGQFENRVDALSLLSRLRRRGVERAALHGADPGGEKIFRVRVGPFDTREKAEEEKERLEGFAQVKGSISELP